MPPDHPSTSSPRGAATAAIDITSIGRATAIIGWLEPQDEPARRGFRAARDGHSVPPPAAHFTLSIGDQRRHLLAVPVAASTLQQCRVEVSALDGAVVAAADRTGRDHQRPGILDLLALSAELAAGERVRLLRFLLEVCPTLLKLSRDPSFIELAHDLIAGLAERPGPLAPRCTAGPLVLLEGIARSGLGARLSGIVIGRSGIVRLAVAPAELPHPKPTAGLARLAFAVERELAVSGGVLVILGDRGVACRRLPTELPPLTAFERAGRDRGFDAPLRNFLVDALISSDATGSSLAPLVHEFRTATSKLRPRAVTGVVRGGIDLVLANRGGILIAGWLDDPHDLTVGLQLLRRDRPVNIDGAALLRFRHASIDRDGRGASGFLCRAAAAVDGDLPASIRISVRLGSGEMIELGDGPSVIPPRAQLTRLLAHCANITLGPCSLAAMLHPVARHAASAQSEPCAIELRDIGPVSLQTPTSLLAPFGGDLELLRARSTAFALDRSLADVEIVHVLEDPRRAPEATALLRMHAELYGRGTRLAIAQRPSSMRDALNATVTRLATPRLVLLDADTLPEASGWLDALAHALAAHPRAGMVAARILNEDDSLVDAGYSRAVGTDGQSRLVTRLAGFPRGFADGDQAARVDAVSGGAWMMRRSLFELIGGFANDYLTAFGADGDFCRRVGAAGFELLQLAAPAFHRLGAKPVVTGEEIAHELDQLSLAARWPIVETTRTVETLAVSPTLGEAEQPAPQPLSAEEPQPPPSNTSKRRHRRSRRAA